MDKNTLEYIGSPGFPGEVRKKFFAAMKSGYAAETKPKKGTIVELPDSKMITFIDGKWEVKDTYLVTPLGFGSGGMTGIWYDGLAVWMKHYGGWYLPEAIPCLKAALRFSYVNDSFDGGRGPPYFLNSDGYTYTNHIEICSTFENFSCKEEVFFPGGEPAGGHWCHGFLMIGGITPPARL